MCILCQKKKQSEYLSRGETGRSCIISLAKETESCDTRTARVRQLTVLEQGIIKYHASSCYRSFQRDMAKTVSILTQPAEQSKPSEQAQELQNDPIEKRCKKLSQVRLKMSVFFVEQIARLSSKKIHTLYRVCEKPMAQKLLNAAMLFKDRVYTETAAMHDINDVFLVS